jgi:hypothetical protein
MALGAQQDIDERFFKKAGVRHLGRDPRLEQRPSFLDLAAYQIEQGIVLNPLRDLGLVVERYVRHDGAGQLTGALGLIDNGRHVGYNIISNCPRR